MQKTQSMVQFVLNYSFPHAASLHHRDSLSTSYFPIVGPAAERGIGHQQKTFSQAKIQYREPCFTHVLWEWKDSFLSTVIVTVYRRAKLTMTQKTTISMIIAKTSWKAFISTEALSF